MSVANIFSASLFVRGSQYQELDSQLTVIFYFILFKDVLIDKYLLICILKGCFMELPVLKQNVTY